MKKSKGFKIFIAFLLILAILPLFVLVVNILNILPSKVLVQYLSQLGYARQVMMTVFGIAELIAIYGIWKLKNLGFILGFVVYGISLITSLIYLKVASFILYVIIIYFLYKYKKMYKIK
ncbi:MAG: hypothetical protein J7K31_01010 [Candidatus Aenigmarchaeota archaeon]|nr:hypothetical protein [Candidatus Aenigmarchaeota archaeon]